MKKDEGLPPPTKGGRTGPDITPEVYSKLNQLAGMDRGVDVEMGRGSEEQSAQMVMEGASLLMQAARINPTLQPIIMPLMRQLQSGVQQLAGGGGEVMAEEGGFEGRPRRRRGERAPQLPETELPY